MSEIKNYKKGTVVFTEGAFEMTMFEIISGRIGIYANYNTDKQQLLTELEAGKMFGEMGLIEVRPRSATAVALEDAELSVISDNNLSDYFKDAPEKVVGILINMTSRLRELSAQYVDACDTISGYVAAETATKPGFWAKLKELITGGEEFGELYSKSLEMGFDPMRYEHIDWY